MKLGVVAVGDEAHALGQERVLDFLFLKPDRALLAGDFGEPRDLVDQFACGPTPHGEGEFHAHRHAVEDAMRAESGSGSPRSRRRK